MAVVAIEELSESLDAGAPLLGLDLGAKTIGLALSDGALIVASPHSTIRRNWCWTPTPGRRTAPLHWRASLQTPRAAMPRI